MVPHSHKDCQNRSGRVSNILGTISSKLSLTPQKVSQKCQEEIQTVRNSFKQARKGSDICKGLKCVMNVLKQARKSLKHGRKISGSVFITSGRVSVRKSLNKSRSVSDIFGRVTNRKREFQIINLIL